jgi:polyvinyl alcohol dehydrogenase (cytochrome)
MTIRWPYLTVVLLIAALSIGCSEKSAEEAPAPETGEASTADAPDRTAAPSGEALYMEHCASCHDQTRYKAPSRFFISMTGPQSVLASMVDGTMVEQASAIDMEGRKAIAEFVAGASLDDLIEPSLPPACDEDHGFDASVAPAAAGFGVDLQNTRFQPAATGGLTVDEVPQLEVKWTFAYPNTYKARSQPGFGGGAIYFGSQDGTVYALDAKTGCLRWTFQAAAEVRTGIVVSPWSADDPNPQPVLYFGDLLARVYAVDARTGALRWKVRVEDHRDATITGTPALHGNRLVVPVSSLEVVPAANPTYACCTFRGSVVALDVDQGQLLWKNYSIAEEPRVVGQNRAGADILAPSGAPFWNSPAIDAKRQRLYVGSGENYSSPADANSDAIIAYDLQNGEKLWVSQQTEGDAWNTACLSEFTSDDANCPEENGPDYDFGASPMLLTLASGRDVVVGGQKSGAVMAIDPDSGETLWKTQVGRGGVQGGVHFGMAVEGNRIFAPINDMFYPEDITRYKFKEPARPGLYALEAESGEIIWSSPAPDLCGGMEHCDPGISAPVTAIPGAVIAGHMDGRLRIYSSETGKVLWELNSLQDFTSVSGATARGGSFSGSGPVVADGMIYVNSGYGIYNHMPGNLLLAIGVAD